MEQQLESPHFYCGECLKGYSCPVLVTMHFQLEHELRCACGLKFCNKGSLEKHLEEDKCVFQFPVETSSPVFDPNTVSQSGAELPESISSGEAFDAVDTCIKRLANGFQCLVCKAVITRRFQMCHHVSEKHSHTVLKVSRLHQKLVVNKFAVLVGELPTCAFCGEPFIKERNMYNHICCKHAVDVSRVVVNVEKIKEQESKIEVMRSFPSNGYYVKSKTGQRSCGICKSSTLSLRTISRHLRKHGKMLRGRIDVILAGKAFLSSAKNRLASSRVKVSNARLKKEAKYQKGALHSRAKYVSVIRGKRRLPSVVQFLTGYIIMKESRFYCALCGMSRHKRSSLYDHIENKHDDILNDAGTSCLSSVGHSEDPEIAVKTEGKDDFDEKYESPRRDSVVDKKHKNLKTIMKASGAKGKAGMYTCPKCKRKFASASGWYKHRKKLCLGNGSALQRSLQSAAAERDKNSSVISKSSVIKPKPTGLKSWCCVMCQRRCSSYDDWKRHNFYCKKKHRTGGRRKATTMELDFLRKNCERKGQKSVCKICGQSYSRIYDTFFHIRKMHDMVVDIATSSAKSKLADTKSFIAKEGVRFVCKVCHKDFAFRNSARIHVRKFHLTESGRPSSRSPSKVKSESSIKTTSKAKPMSRQETNNINSKHLISKSRALLMGAKPKSSVLKSCGLCAKRFFSLQNLKAHVKAAHLDCDSSPIQCPLCENSLGTFQALVTHFVYRHCAVSASAKRPCKYYCTMCNISFVNRGGLIQHRSTVHADICIKCDYCDMVCTSESVLKRHKRALHSFQKLRSKVYTEESEIQALSSYLLSPSDQDFCMDTDDRVTDVNLCASASMDTGDRVTDVNLCASASTDDRVADVNLCASASMDDHVADVNLCTSASMDTGDQVADVNLCAITATTSGEIVTSQGATELETLDGINSDVRETVGGATDDLDPVDSENVATDVVN